MSIDFIKNIIFVAIFFVATNNCFAWVGYDQNSNGKIEIGAGNLVKEGETIEFYDWQNEESRNGEVREVEDLFNSTKLKIYDLVDNEIRVFDMEN